MPHAFFASLASLTFHVSFVRMGSLMVVMLVGGEVGSADIRARYCRSHWEILALEGATLRIGIIDSD